MVIQIENLQKRYQGVRRAGILPTFRGTWQHLFSKRGREAEGRPALDGVSLQIDGGQAVGLIGGNGAGKTTLLKILCGITPPTQGRVTVYGRVAPLLGVGAGFHPDLPGRENVFLVGSVLGMKRAEVKRCFDEIVAFADVADFLDQPVKHYSTGIYARLALSVALHLRSDILLVDEILGGTDEKFRTRCLARLRRATQHGQTLLFVSHDLAAIRAVCPTTLQMAKGKLVANGPTETVIQNYLRE